MKYYLAPLEGITTYIYRNAYHRVFTPADKYFTPFLVPKQKKSFSSRERNDILPEHNQGLFVIPQLLTSRAEDFIRAARTLMEYGYEEINLNLGCPSGTVVSKGKGAGFLAHPAELNGFLEEVFSSLTLRISIKTRIGVEEPEEFDTLLNIFNQYPLEELIIHPRVREDYYRNPPRLSVFARAMEESRNPVCYNGNIFSRRDCEELLDQFPNLPAVMLGRGIIASPDLGGECRKAAGLKQEEVGRQPEQKEWKQKEDRKQKFWQFHTLVYQGYQEIPGGECNVLYKMKELWSYMAQSFSGYEPYAKQIKKAESLKKYETVIQSLFREQEVTDHGRLSF